MLVLIIQFPFPNSKFTLLLYFVPRSADAFPLVPLMPFWGFFSDGNGKMEFCIIFGNFCLMEKITFNIVSLGSTIEYNIIGT